MSTIIEAVTSCLLATELANRDRGDEEEGVLSRLFTPLY